MFTFVMEVWDQIAIVCIVFMLCFYYLAYLPRRLLLWQAIIMFISMTFNIVCCHFRKERDFTLSLTRALTRSLTHPFATHSSRSVRRMQRKNKTKRNTIETTTIQLSTTLSALCCVVWQFVLGFRMQPHSVSQSLSTQIPSHPDLPSLSLSLCVLYILRSNPRS